MIETLAKVIIAAGWADKTFSAEEKGNLKDLLFRFENTLQPLNRGTNIGLNSRTSALFELYTSSCIDTAERGRLLAELQANVRSEEDRALVPSALQSMIEADGRITEEEQAVLNEDMVHVGIGLGLSQEAATFVTEVALAETKADFDYLRKSREFMDIAASAERVR